MLALGSDRPLTRTDVAKWWLAQPQMTGGRASRHLLCLSSIGLQSCTDRSCRWYTFCQFYEEVAVQRCIYSMGRGAASCRSCLAVNAIF